MTAISSTTLSDYATHWIGGRAIRLSSSDPFEVLDPVSGSPVAAISDDPNAVSAAVDAADAAFGAWSRLAPTARRDLLVEAARALEREEDALASIHALETGKPDDQARGEIRAAVTAVRSMADLGVYVQSGAQQSAFGELLFQYREPRGVAGCIVPWNYPVITAAENIAANLVMGNTIVLKPSEKTPLATRAMAELAFASLPPGVCNVVLGAGTVGQRLVEDSRVRLVVFVGSPAVGRAIASLTATDFKKVILELGGKDALIVDETVDPASAASLAAACAFVNVGQICTSTERIYVVKEAYDGFVDAFLEETTRYVPIRGDARETGNLGPLIDRLQLERVDDQVQEAVRDGATVRTGGAPIDGAGYFYPPTVLTDVPRQTRLMREETFGPIAPVELVESFSAGIERANDTPYGLAAVVCTTSAERAVQAIQELRVGMVKINTPRGRVAQSTSEPSGISGVGHGYGLEYLCEVTRQKSVHWRSQP